MQERKKGNAVIIDVSHHQGNIDFEKVALSGVHAVICKATQNRIDPKFKENIIAAREAGLLVGAYHYLDAKVKDTKAAEAAANDFVDAILSVGGVDLPPALDYEEKDNLSPAQCTSIAAAFLSRVQERLKQQPMIYTGSYFLGNLAATVLGKYPLWIARYSTQAPKNVGGWYQWDIWQYSDGQVGGTLHGGGRAISGIRGPVDLNEYDGTPEDLHKRWGNGQDVVEPATPTKVRVYMNGQEKVGYLINDKTYVWVRDLKELYGFPVGFDDKEKRAIVNGRTLSETQLIDGQSYVQVEPFVKAYGDKATWINETKKLFVVKEV